MEKRATIVMRIALLCYGIGLSGLIVGWFLLQGYLFIIFGIGMIAGSVLLNVSLAMFRKMMPNEKQR